MELRGYRRANKPQSGLFSRHYYSFFAGDCQQKGDASGCLSGKEMV